MVARLWALKIKSGDKKFKDVPDGLKDQVRMILTSMGLAHKAVE